MSPKSRNKEHDKLMQLLESLMGSDWRVYNASLAKALGSTDAAIFYQQCCYWSSRTKDKVNGWFYKTVEEFKEELAMSRCKQDTAIRILLKHKLIEKKRGYMGKRYFRITLNIANFCRENGMFKSTISDCRKLTIRND